MASLALPLLHCPRSRGRREAPPSAWERVYIYPTTADRIPIVLGHVIHSRPHESLESEVFYLLHECIRSQTHEVWSPQWRTKRSSWSSRGDCSESGTEIVPNWTWRQNSRLKEALLMNERLAMPQKPYRLSSETITAINVAEVHVRARIARSCEFVHHSRLMTSLLPSLFPQPLLLSSDCMTCMTWQPRNR